mgnify:FL=1|tara:strand:+ start:234 stop:710 length:477 start_codon:yes stop_codon:yes gene_type:complete
MSEEVQQPVEEDILTPEYISIDDWKSNKIDKLAGALAKAQSEMGGVSKGKVNPFYKSNYADINSCIEACMPALNKHGLSISQGNRFCNTSGYYITTMLMHESGQWLRSEIRIPLTNKKDAQEIGSACTYGRRYGLTSMVGLAQVDDDGNATVNNRSVK